MAENEKRLNKYLAESGVASRRGADEIIVAGRVRVNGQVVSELGAKVNAGRDRITVDSKSVRPEKRILVLMLNKPRGIVTTVKDPKAGKTLEPWLNRYNERLYPVGRLDRDSEGLLLLTNDGELTNLLTHPRYHMEREYRVTVRGKLTAAMTRSMREGLILDDGPTQPADVYNTAHESDRSRFNIILREGRSRQIRRMCEKFEMEVIRLKRIRIGPVWMNDMKSGDIRELKDKEIRQLRHEATHNPPQVNK